MTQQDDVVMLGDLDTFVTALTGWHVHKVATLQHMLEIPEGTKMVAGDSSVILSGDVLAGFKQGIELALMELGTLPFTTEEEPTSV